MLAIFVILIVAQLMFAILDPATLAAATQPAPIGVIGPRARLGLEHDIARSSQGGQGWHRFVREVVEA